MSGSGGVSTKVKPFDNRLSSASESLCEERFTTPEKQLRVFIQELELLALEGAHNKGNSSIDTLRSAMQKSTSSYKSVVGQ